MALSRRTSGWLYAIPLPTPSTMEEIAQWSNALRGQERVLAKKQGAGGQRLVVQEVENLFLVAQPDGRATALALVRLCLPSPVAEEEDEE